MDFCSLAAALRRAAPEVEGGVSGVAVMANGSSSEEEMDNCDIQAAYYGPKVQAFPKVWVGFPLAVRGR